MELDNTEIRRYARHLILPEVGMAGQQRIRAARVLCVGAGGLGSPAAMYLAAAGIGCLGVIDDDLVDESNLQRQLLHGTPDVGQPKAESAAATLRRLNPHVDVVPIRARLTSANARELISAYDVVLDGSDNLPTRYLVNDACVFLKKPNVYGAIYRWEGQASLFAPHLGAPCYRCLFPEPPPPEMVPSCAEGGVLGVLPGLIGCIQATETLKLILGQGTSLLGRLLLVNALEMSFRELHPHRDPGCPVCGTHPTITELVDYEVTCQAPLAAPVPSGDEVSVHELRRVLSDPALGVAVIDIREPPEWEIARLDGVPLIPMSVLPERVDELDRGKTYYLLCHAGVRSRRTAAWMRGQGFAAVKSVQGGLQAWSQQIDPSLPTY